MFDIKEKRNMSEKKQLTRESLREKGGVVVRCQLSIGKVHC